MRPYRTVLEQKIRERRMTLEEFVTYAENFAREHGEPGTLSLRHLQRLVAGKGPKGQPLGPVRPATARLLERIFEMDNSELLSSPMRVVAPPDDDAAELRERIQTSRRVDAGMLRGLRDQLNRIRRIDRQYGAIVTNNELLAEISQTRDLLTYSLTGNNRRDLAILLSEMHSLAGWQTLDMGFRSASWLHYENAKSAALETEDVAYHAHAAAEQAFTLIDLGESKAAVCLIESARQDAQRSPHLLRGWLAAAHGEALSVEPNRQDSLSSFDEAEYLISSSQEYKGPYIVLDSNHLARWRSSAEYRYGTALTAVRIRNALGKLNPTYLRAEAALRTDLAFMLATYEDADAYEQMNCAESISLKIGSTRQMKRILSLRRWLELRQAHTERAID